MTDERRAIIGFLDLMTQIGMVGLTIVFLFTDDPQCFQWAVLCGLFILVNRSTR